MSDSGKMQCCGRDMTRIAVEHPTAEVELLSCSSCGQHAWRRDGQAVDRAGLLETLQAHRPAVRAVARQRRAVPETVSEDARRADLQRRLTAFTVHGSTS